MKLDDDELLTFKALAVIAIILLLIYMGAR